MRLRPVRRRHKGRNRCAAVMRSKNKGMSGACIHSREKIAGTRCPSTTRCHGPQVVEKLLKTGASDNHQEPESFGRRDSKLALDHWVGRLQCGSVHKGEGTHAGPQTPRSREKHGALLRPDDRDTLFGRKALLRRWGRIGTGAERFVSYTPMKPARPQPWLDGPPANKARL